MREFIVDEKKRPPDTAGRPRKTVTRKSRRCVEKRGGPQLYSSPPSVHRKPSSRRGAPDDDEEPRPPTLSQRDGGWNSTKKHDGDPSAVLSWNDGHDDWEEQVATIPSHPHEEAVLPGAYRLGGGEADDEETMLSSTVAGGSYGNETHLVSAHIVTPPMTVSAVPAPDDPIPQESDDEDETSLFCKQPYRPWVIGASVCIVLGLIIGLVVAVTMTRSNKSSDIQGVFPSPTPAAAPSPTAPSPTTPSLRPTLPPTQAQGVTATLETDKLAYEVGETIWITFNISRPENDDWIGIYPAEFANEDDLRSYSLWQWACGSRSGTCSSGRLGFNETSAFDWPLTPGSYRAFMSPNTVRPYPSFGASEFFTVGEVTPSSSPVPQSPSQPPPTSAQAPVTGSWSQIGEDIFGQGEFGFGGPVSLSGDGTILAVDEDVRVRVLERSSDAWTNQQDISNGGSPFSLSLSRDGNRLAIGYPGDDTNAADSGQVRVYERSGDVWEQIGGTLVGVSAGDAFGYSVSLSEDGGILAVGAIQSQASGLGSEIGFARVYELSEGVWTPMSQDFVGQDGDRDLWGWATALSADGSVLAVGGGNGNVEVHRLENGFWNKVGQTIDHAGMFASPNAAGNVAVSMSSCGCFVAIGAWWHHDYGQVRVFQLTEDTWMQIGQALDGLDEEDSFGVSVSLSSDASTLAVGADQYSIDDKTRPGYVQVFSLSADGTWVPLGQQLIGEAAADEFGRFVSLSADGTILAVGGPGNDGGGSNLGHVRIYELTQ